MSFISRKKYDEILQVLPICCVDIVILHDDKLLVIKRGGSETYGGMWWIPGGRIHKGESWETAIKRKSLVETGLNVKILRQKKSYEAPETEGKHFVTTLFVTSVIGNLAVKLDETSTDYRWVNSIDSSWHWLLKKMIRDAEVFDV